MNLIKIIFKKTKTGLFLYFPNFAWYLNKFYWINYIKLLKIVKKDLILELPYGGLGDHLIYSAFPEAIQRKFGVKVNISEYSNIRNNEITNLIWKKNPHVKIIKEHGVFITCPIIKKYTNYNEALFEMLGLKTKNIKIYYKPKKRICNDVVCDLTFGPSGAFNGYTDKKFSVAVKKYLNNNYHNKKLIFLIPNIPNCDRSIVDYILKNRISRVYIKNVKTIYETIDMLYSAKKVICLYSGSASLCAAINKNATVLCNKLANPYFIYKNNTYINLIAT